MSDGPRNYELNFEAANELEHQTTRAKAVLERLAAHLAAETQTDPNLQDLVEERHVRQAAELLLGSRAPAQPATTAPSRAVFISHSHEDAEFVRELSAKLRLAGMECFLAERDVQLAADWASRIWDAIRACPVVLLVVTPRFFETRWFHLECGAACAAGKTIVPVLRYVDRSKLQPPLDRFQSQVVETEGQLNDLIANLRTITARAG
jgi:TIR domain-containing protein